ncbi:hypothetical protein EDD11_004278 [Mortierella claussenii]|nr:hypothetical protein EDD11_004278 [Mortierella claussenii]
MQRTTTTTTRQRTGKDTAQAKDASVTAPTYPLLRMTLVAMANLTAAYSTLLWVPTLMTETHPDTATTPQPLTSNSIQTLPSLPWTLVALFGFQTLVGLIQAQLHVLSVAVPSKKMSSKTNSSSSPFSAMSTSMAIGAVGALICHVFAVLFGAGLFYQAKETSQLASYLSLLTFYPASFVLGTDLKSWIRIYIHNSPQTYTEAALYCQGMMAIFGAWLGSIVIPLDWDRPWQAWPVPCVLGAFLFYCIGTVAGLVVSIVMRQRVARIEFGIDEHALKKESKKTKLA